MEISARFIDSHTQTDIMDISKTDHSSIINVAHPLKEKCNVDADNKQLYNKPVKCLNGNSILPEMHYTMQSNACSSPESLNENNSNGNECLKDCSDDDNLETLGRKVSEIINANRLISPIDNGNCDDIIITHR